MRTMWRPEHNALLDSRMVGRSLDAHNECSALALMEETPRLFVLQSWRMIRAYSS